MDGEVGVVGGSVVPFVGRASHPLGFSVSERIETLRWADAARAHGVNKVRVCEPEPGDEPGVGGFVLIYKNADLWANWGVAVRAGSFEVWRPANGVTVGWYRTLGEALHVIQEVG
jgi:hypothetical protein